MVHQSIRAAVLALVLSMTCGTTLAWKPEVGEVPGSLGRVEYLDGRPVDLSVFRGAPVILYFGADWCGPCRSTGRPALLDVWKKYQARGLKAVYVNLDDNKYRDMKVREAEAMDMPIAMLNLAECPPGACLTKTRDMGAFGKAYTIPFAVVLDAEGIVRAKLQGGRGVLGGLDEAVASVLRP